ncbi:MAG: nitroreductase family protein [Nanoarchaeota archaeon]
MDIFEAIFSRVPVEEYTEEPVEFDKILQILNAANHASSAGHLQAWKFILVTSKEKIRSLIPYCLKQDCLYTAQFAIVVCLEEDQYEAFYGLRGKRLYTVQDCGAAIQNMLLAAYAIGLGAHWVRAFDEDRIKEVFGIPGNARPQGIVTLGYPVKLPSQKVMKDLQAMVYYNGYGSRIEYGYRAVRDYSIDVQKYKKLVQEQIKPMTYSLADHAKKLFLKSKANVSEKTSKLKERLHASVKKLKKERR